MDAFSRRLAINPAIGLGVAVTIGLALGTGMLSGLLPFGRSTPAPAPATVSTSGGGPVVRQPTSDVAMELDALDQEI